ncbi:MAG: hypothetical protein EHM79_20280 [Geobacter sp.]|nr:MAG: hypothetical protein EHM79_20280 [Geobacter sp.]
MDILVQRRVAKMDGATLAEVAMEKVVQSLEKLFTEARERLERFVDVALQPREYPLGVVPGLDPHQIDVSGFTFNLGPDKYIPQGIIKLLLTVYISSITFSAGTGGNSHHNAFGKWSEYMTIRHSYLKAANCDLGLTSTCKRSQIAL